MIEAKSIKVKNFQRQQQKETAKRKYNHMTPQKYLDKQSTCRTVSRLEKKFGYDYDFSQSKPLKYLKEEFLNNTLNYLGKREWTKKLGRQDKYEINIQHGRALQKNPLMKIFNRIQSKMTQEKSQCFEIIKLKFEKEEKTQKGFHRRGDRMKS